jgi:hypothetical protein
MRIRKVLPGVGETALDASHSPHVQPPTTSATTNAVATATAVPAPSTAGTSFIPLTAGGCWPAQPYDPGVLTREKRSGGAL